jgi:hypothetical protein
MKTRIDLFKTVKLEWWQASFLKVGALAAGIAIGTYWYYVFWPYMTAVLIVALVGLGYYAYVWSKQ